MNPGLRSTTYDVNDLFSTSSKELSKKSIRLMTILQNTDNYIIHIYILYILLYIYIFICLVTPPRSTLPISCLAGLFMCLQCQRHIF